MIVCILGMHRSGTSMVARLLNLCGVYLGEEKDLIPAAEDNPEGFWENVKFQEINQELLITFGGEWDYIPSLEAGWQLTPQVLDIHDRARSLVEEFSEQAVWGWKDPRTSLTLPFWKTLVPDLKVVICLRNPYEVYRSLARRGYASSNFSYNLWLSYNRYILAATDPENRIVTHFDTYFYDARSELRRLIDYLEIEVPDRTIDSACKIASIGLKHHNGSISDLIETKAPQQVFELYNELCHQAGSVYYLSLSSEERDSLDSAWPGSHVEADILQDRRILDLTEILAQRDKQILGLKSTVKQNEEKISRLIETVEQKALAIKELNSEVARLQTEIQQIFTSRSWKAISLFQKIRLFFVPLGSRRERFFSNMLHGISTIKKVPSVIRREGIKGLLLRAQNRSNINAPVANSPEIAKTVYNELISNATNSSQLSDEFVSLTEENFSAEEALIKLIAFYLPQFHPIPENDIWWGKGFTEWTNVSKAVPQFVGHYQPRLPGELGFYDLRVPDVQRRQIELARKYGIYGFAFYYYWFNGKRLLEKPLDLFLKGNEDFPFCVCWANENWTRRWDGQEEDILITQQHSLESDRRFIEDISPILRNKRYIRINGRPLLIVYRANILPNVLHTVALWREYCQKQGIGDPYLVAAQTFWFDDPREVGFDAALEFPPHNVAMTGIRHRLRISNPGYKGDVVEYKEIVEKTSSILRPEYQLFRTVFPSWDNEARKPGRGYTFAFSTPSLYKDWLLQAARFTLKEEDPEKKLLFINAWNEWGEGAYLEPDRKYGYAYLQATADALKELSDERDRR